MNILALRPQFIVTHLAEIKRPFNDELPALPIFTNVPPQVFVVYSVQILLGATGIADKGANCKLDVQKPSRVIRVMQFPAKFVSGQMRISATIGSSANIPSKSTVNVVS